MKAYQRLTVKSNVHNYSVMFVESFSDGLQGLKSKKLFFIVDQALDKYYGDELSEIKKRYPYMLLEASEDIKTLDYAKKIIRHLIDVNVKKDFFLVGIGGGVIQDITGFVASILYRGVKWVFFPTTLSSQCDSCIGSKTSINVDEYKNQVGNFYPPFQVVLDTNFLNTLPEAEIKSGLGEIIKVHLLDSKKAMRFINKNYDAALSNYHIMRQLIFRSLKIKKRIIEKDEFDTGYRNIMNYGHTFGHALESLTQYKLSHGQAVTIGMDISDYLSWKLGYIRKNVYKQMRSTLLKNWPEYSLKNFDLQIFFRSLTKDKKNIDNKVTMILTQGPGKMIKKSFLIDGRVKDYFLNYFSELLNDER